MLTLGLDVGTQGTKGLILDGETGSVVAQASHAYDLLSDLPPGSAEQAPDTWIEAAQSVIASLLADPAVKGNTIVAVGVSGQQHGAVLLDEEGFPLRPAKLWCDTSTAAEAKELSERFGRPVPVGYTASKILWTLRNEPQIWERTHSVMLPHDYLNYRLTGSLFTEAGDASGTGYFNSQTRDYHQEEMALIDPDLPRRVPPLRNSEDDAITLSDGGSQLFGLPQGTLVSLGGGDNMMSAIGSGATASGTVVVSLGTSGTVFTYSDQPVIDPEGLIAPFCDSTGGWLPLLCVMNATGVTEEVVSTFPGETLASLTSQAEEVAPGCEGLTWLPYLVGERVPDLPHAHGVLLGVGEGALQPGRLFRAALEGTSLNLAWGIDRMRDLGVKIDGVRLVGGGSKNPLWASILADAIGVPVSRLAEAESAALGAALQALWTARRSTGDNPRLHDLASPLIEMQDEPIEPDPERVTFYADLGEAFRAAVEKQFGS